MSCDRCEEVEGGEVLDKISALNHISLMLCTFQEQLDSLIDASGGEPVGLANHSFTTGTDSPIPEDAYSVRIQVTEGSITINTLTYTAPAYVTFTAEPRRKLPDIVISGAGTYAWERMA